MAGNSIAAAGDPDFKTLFGYSLVHIRFDINMLSILALAGRLLKLSMMIVLHVKRERLAVDVSIAPTITNIHYFYALFESCFCCHCKMHFISTP